MTFTKHVCWNTDMINKVLNTEALQVPDHIFLATHCPMEIYKIRQNSSPQVCSEEAFYEDFMAQRDHTLVAILGDAGTGKSHLVKWLSVRIPRTSNQKVLLIPKVGTNLKSIIELILRNMQGDQFREYERRMLQATNGLTEGMARLQHLHSIIQVIGPHGPLVGRVSDEEGKDLIEYLPGLLGDTYYKNQLLKDGGIIDSLTKHILGNRVGEQNDHPLEFTVADLPSDLAKIGQASHDAIEIYSLLEEHPELKKKAVAWINENLREAISMVMSFNGEDISALFVDIRETLAREGVELIILIEDFAKLQGIDSALLEALLVRPRQGERILCNLRAAIAVTSGYFNRMDDTVKNRIEFRINLGDEEKDTLKEFSDTDVTRLAGRYLNAIRHTEADIKKWHDKRLGKVEEQQEELESFCINCEYRNQCHGAFDCIEGIGLYPYTPLALKNMIERVSSGKYNPRKLVDVVLKHVLENYTSNILEGSFPPEQLITIFPPKKMQATLQMQLDRSFPGQGKRMSTFLELWNKPTIIENLNPNIHNAFQLPLINLLDESPVIVTVPTDLPKPKVENGSELPLPLQKKIIELDAWGNGKTMSQTLVNELRPLFYNAIYEFIDWDSLHLLEGFIRNNFFKQVSVNFNPQATSYPLRAVAPIQLIIPLSPSQQLSASVGLQALLLYNHYKSWEMLPNRVEYFIQYSNLIETSAQFVQDQLYRTQIDTENLWNPVPAAIEALTITSILSGDIPERQDCVENWTNALFAKRNPLNVVTRAKDWNELLVGLIGWQDELVKIITGYACCTKGGSSRIQVIDASQIIPVIEILKNNKWNPLMPISKGQLCNSLQSIQKTNEKIRALLTTAISSEHNRCIEWQRVVIDSIDNSSGWKTLVNKARLMEKDATNAGIVPSQKLSYVFADKPEVAEKLKETLLAIKQMKNEKDSADLLIKLGAIDSAFMSNVSLFLESLEKYAESVDKRASKDIEDLALTEENILIAEQQQKILDRFAEMEKVLVSLGGVTK